MEHLPGESGSSDKATHAQESAGVKSAARIPMRVNKCLKRFLLVLGLVFLAGILVGTLFPSQILCVEKPVATADCMIVLGGGFPERPEHAARLFHEGLAPLIIVSGTNDATFSRDLLISEGVPAAAIVLEPNSISTRQNAQFTLALLHNRHIQRAAIVTSWYHSRRALACFEKFCPGVEFYSIPTSWKGTLFSTTSEDVRHVFQEYVKVAGYWVCYGVNPL